MPSTTIEKQTYDHALGLSPPKGQDIEVIAIISLATGDWYLQYVHVGIRRGCEPFPS